MHLYLAKHNEDALPALRFNCQRRRNAKVEYFILFTLVLSDLCSFIRIVLFRANEKCFFFLNNEDYLNRRQVIKPNLIKYIYSEQDNKLTYPIQLVINN